VDGVDLVDEVDLVSGLTLNGFNQQWVCRGFIRGIGEENQQKQRRTGEPET